MNLANGLIGKNILLSVLGLIIALSTIYTNELLKKVVNEDLRLVIKIIRIFYAIIVIMITALILIV